MSIADQIEIRVDDMKLVARALCAADGALGAPCVCNGEPSTCSALEVYGDQARRVLAALGSVGRLAGEPVRLTPQLVEGFFEQNAVARGWLKPDGGLAGRCTCGSERCAALTQHLGELALADWEPGLGDLPTPADVAAYHGFQLGDVK